MLTVAHLSKSYGIEPVLDKISFNLNNGERLGLVGPNGCGKTTLLRILVGVEKADSGSFRLNLPADRVGYLPQGMSPDSSTTIEAFLAEKMPNLAALEADVERLARQLAVSPSQLEFQGAYDAALARMEAASQTKGYAETVLARLGLGDFPPQTPVRQLSGGQKTRLALASVLLSAPQLLLLDEPTNHLDIAMLEWLEDWLLNFHGAVLLVSHDRAFLDRVASGILEIDPFSHTLKAYSGGYTQYLEQMLAEREEQWQVYRDQQEEISQLRRSAQQIRHAARFKAGGKGDSGDKFAKGFFENRSAGTIRRARQLEKRLERLLTSEKAEKPRQEWQVKLDFQETWKKAAPGGRQVVILEDLAIGYADQAMLSGLSQVVRHGDRIALIGPNGSGKTTLLRTLAGLLPPVAGQARLGANIRPGIMAQEQEDLDLSLDAFTTIRKVAPYSETEVRTFLHRFLFSGDDVFIPLSALSYGERARLSLARMVAEGCNLLLMDEPINHLDIPARTRFEAALDEFDGTILAVVHDRYFIQGFARIVWELKDGQLIVFELEREGFDSRS